MSRPAAASRWPYRGYSAAIAANPDDLVEDIVDLGRARISQAANLTVLKTLDEMQKTALDILA